MAISSVLTVSVIAALAASSLVLVGRHALGEGVSRSPLKSQQGAISLISQVVVSNSSVAQRAASPAVRVPAVKIKNRVLMVSRALLDEVQIDYNLSVPMSHVRPDSAETLTPAAIIDEATTARLLKIAHSGPENMEVVTEEEASEGPTEFDCLSEMFRSTPLPKELSSTVVNGMSTEYAVRTTSDGRNVVFAPMTIQRGDYPASEIPNTALHDAPFKNHVSISVPSGGTLLIDAGAVKANRKESTPSLHLLVLVQPQVMKGKLELSKAEQRDLAKAE